MSSYPGNPYWDQEGDQPIPILSRAEWDEAEREGHLTAEHVLLRMKHIAEHDLIVGGSVGFDVDGFVISLVAESLQATGGVTLIVRTNDHPPPHAHIEVKGRPEIKLTVNLATAEIVGDIPDGWSKKVRSIQRAVRGHHAMLAGWWEKNHGTRVDLQL